MDSCPTCGENLIFRETPESTHYGRLDCIKCNKWICWVKNPEKKTYRDKTTKCNIDYDFCKMCLRTKDKLGFSETLTAHHIIPLTDGGEDKTENIIVICSACHKLVHWLQLYNHKHLERFFENGNS